MYKGSCLCGAIAYEVISELKAVTHCHCKMCQKQHGAAFATYASVKRQDLHYLTDQTLLGIFQSSENITRKFCSRCGSNIEWSGSIRYPGCVSIAIATLDTEFYPHHIQDIYVESRPCWLNAPK